MEKDINTEKADDKIKLKTIGIICLVIFLVLSIPIPMRLKDGGSVVYRGLYYKITDVHTLVEEPGKGYEEGIIIELFGNEVYNSVK